HLRDAAYDTASILRRLQDFPRIGPTGAAISAREAQDVWPALAPCVDTKAVDVARKAGLPEDADELVELIDPSDRSRIAAALARVALDEGPQRGQRGSAPHSSR